MPPKKRKSTSNEKKDDKENNGGESSGEGEQAPDSAFEMKVDEKVLAYHRNMLYEAKVLKRKLKKTSEPSYFIHYKGWNSKWDEWVEPSRLKKFTPENLKERDALAKKGKGGNNENGEDGEREEGGSKKKNSKKRKKKEKSESESDDDDEDDNTVEPEKPKAANGAKSDRVKCDIKIKIPGALKKQLVLDWEWVTRDRKLVDLPKKKYSVSAVMEEYLASKKRNPSTQKIAEEVVTGIKQYFDRAVGRVLLYKFERPQNQDLSESKKGVQNCDIYGAEHLLRLFVKLPELLASTDMEKEEVSVLQNKIGELVRFIDKKRADYFAEPYVTTDKDYHEKAAQEPV